MRTFGFLLLALAIGLLGAHPHDAAARQLAFTLDTPPFRYAEATAIASQLKALNIAVSVQVRNRDELEAEIRKATRQAYLTDWGSAFFDPFDLVLPKLRSDGRGNFSFFSDPQLDALLERASTSDNDDTRQMAYDEAQKLIFEKAPMVFGYVLDQIMAQNLDVQHFKPALDGRINLHDVRLKKGDTLAVGMNTGSFFPLDPGGFRGRETETVIRNLFDALVTRTPDGQVVPELAKSWQKTSRLTYVFKLREGPRFHDQTPVRAEDVVFTFQRILEDKGIGRQTSPRRGLLGPLERVEALDPLRIRFNLNKPFPPFLQALVHFQIVPRHVIREKGDAAFAAAPVGCGPFEFVSADLNQEVRMRRFQGYYGGSPEIPPIGTAHIETVRFRAMPEPFTRVAALLAGELGIVQDVPAGMIANLRANPLVELQSCQGTRSYQMELNTRQPPFDDIRVRQALNHAIDWAQILDTVYHGLGQRLATCFLPSGFGFRADIKPYAHDLQKAVRLLTEAGYDSNIGSHVLQNTGVHE